MSRSSAIPIARFGLAATFAFVVSLARLAMGGGGSSHAGRSPVKRAPTSTGAQVLAPPASTSAQAPVTTASPSARVPRRGPTLAQVTSELQARCWPKPPATTNMELKMQSAEAVECIRKKLSADLDAVLLPLKTSDPIRFKALMAEQATWNRALGPSCYVAEELEWLDFDHGTRDDGTARGYATMGCHETALTERVLYARSLATADATTLGKHINEVAEKGEKVKRHLLARQKLAAKWTVPPKAGSLTTEDTDNWRHFIDAIQHIQKNTKDLARSTCAGWPELSTALGGSASCEQKAELYYYLQGNVPPVSP